MDRLKVFQIFVYILALLVLARLFYWQFIADIKSSSTIGLQELKIPAHPRENIASDSFPLKKKKKSYLVYAKPKNLEEDSKNIARTLAPFLTSEKYSTSGANLSEKDKDEKEKEIESLEKSLEEKLSSDGLIWVQLARKIPQEAKEKIQSLNIEGIDFEEDDRRYYPEASMAAQLLGFVGFDKFGEDTGYFGLEGYYDSKLKGKTGRLGLFKDPFGFPILVNRYRPVNTRQGSSLYLSINRSIQFLVEKKLGESVEKYGAKQGTVIVTKPQTGQVLAMATFPTYNPRFFTGFDESLYKNPAVANTYEPGSTFKLITTSAALDSEVVDPKTKCDVCSGPRIISGHKVSTWNDKYYPDTNIIEIIQHSDNVGMTFVAEKLGVEKFVNYMEKFGFGKSTNIDLQEEAIIAIRDEDQWRPIDLATASFGQGIAVTPIQMIQAVGAIASGGKLISPTIVEKIIEDGKEKVSKPKEERQVISPKTASLVTEMMVNAVENGEAQAFAPKGYRIAGKTGTAQIPVAGHYDPEKTIASFVGFAPADDPEFAMLVLFSEPSTSPYGSETAAPTFFSIATEILRYMGISPNRD